MMETKPVITIRILEDFSPTNNTIVHKGETYSGNVTFDGGFVFWVANHMGVLEKAILPKWDERVNFIP